MTAGQKSGTITFSNTIGNAGAGVISSNAIKIGNTNTSTVAFSSSLYSFDGATTITSASGDNITVGATAEFETKQDALTFATGTIKLANNANLTVNSDGQVITIDSIAGTSDETVTINADVVTGGLNATTTETVRIGNVGDSGHAEIHNLTITGEDGITLTGAIYTSGVDGDAADVKFNDKVLIDGAVTVDTDDAAGDGVIKFTTSIEAATGTGVASTQSLTLQGGAGTITLVPIGAAAGIDSLTINTQTTATADLDVKNIGSGTVDAEASSTSVAGVTGATNIGNTNAGHITFSGTIYKTDGSFTVTSDDGTNTSDKEIIFSGSSPFISTSGDAVSFNGGEVEIQAGTLTINTLRDNAGDNSSISNGGAITFAKTVFGKTDESLVLDAHSSGTGTISLAQVGDGTTPQIAGLTATAAGGITLNGDINTSDAGTGITFNSGVIIADNTTVTITTDSGGTDGGVTFNSSISGTGDTTTKLTNNDNLTIVSGAGDVSIGSVGTSTATVLNNLLINATADGANRDGNITITGNIGSTSGSTTNDGVRGTLTLGNTATALLTLGGTVYNTNGGTYTAKTGDTIKITGTNPIFTASDAAIEFSTGTVLINDGTGGSLFKVVNSGSGITVSGVKGSTGDSVTLDAGTDSDGSSATVTVNGAIGSADQIVKVNITGNDGVTLKGDITTDDATGAEVNITGGITIASAGAGITIDTNVATNDGSITLGTVNGAKTLTIDSGQGDVSIGVIGGVTALTGLTINTADD